MKVRSIPAAVPVEPAGTWAYMAAWLVTTVSPLCAPKTMLTSSSSHSGERPDSSSRPAEPATSVAAPATSIGQTRLRRAASAETTAAAANEGTISSPASAADIPAPCSSHGVQP
jgi:hypothetical protein